MFSGDILLTERPIFNTSTCFFLVSILFLNISRRLYDISPYVCLPLKLKPSLFRFTARPLGYRGRRDPQPLHNRFYPLFVSIHIHSTRQVQLTLFCNCAVALPSQLASHLSSTSPTCSLDTGLLHLSSPSLYPNLSHLRYNGQEYDVSWTMPQCVLCLRLIGQFCWLWTLDSKVPCYLQWLQFTQWQSFGILFRLVMGCVWRREAKNEADQSFPWPGKIIWIFEGWSQCQESAVAEEISTCQLSKHSWAALPLLLCWRLFCWAPVYHEEIPTGELKSLLQAC